MALNEVKALTFDVFGTVVDYRSTIIDEGEQLNRQKGWQIDWAAVADAWRGRYRPFMERVAHGDLPWTKLDTLHRMALEEILEELHITGLSEEEKTHLNFVWHRLRPWHDAVAGLTRLRTRFTLATLSNGNVSLLVDMAKHSHLPWDCIFSAELARAYKPDPRVYRLAIELLSLQPHEVMMVASHQNDLRAAQAEGMRTAFITRPLEFGRHHIPNMTADPSFDIVATDLIDLANKLNTDSWG